MVIFKVVGRWGEWGRCDHRCYDAVSRKCTCCCGGVNHGKGLKKALNNRSHMYNDQILANLAIKPGSAKVVRPRPEAGLF